MSKVATGAALFMFFCAQSSIVHAKSSVELSMSGLAYETAKTDADLEDVDITNETTELRTLEPNLGIDVYGDRLWLNVVVDAKGDSTSGTISGGYEVAPKIYVGLGLALENTKEESTTKVKGGSESTSESEKKFLALGPLVYYRAKSDSSIIDAYGILASAQSVETSESGTPPSEEKSTVKMMLLQFGGDYYFKVVERLYLGFGLSYQKSLSGSTEQKSETTELDGDYDFSQLTLTLLQFRIDV